MKCPNCKWSPQEALQALCDASSVSKMALSLGVTLDAVYKWLRGDRAIEGAMRLMVYRRWVKLSKPQNLNND